MPTYMAETTGPFADYLHGKGLSEGTVTRHRLAIFGGRKGFACTVQRIKGPRPTMGQIDHQCVDTWFAAHEGSSGARANKIESIRHYLRWAENRGLLRAGFTADKLLEGYKGRRGQRQPKYYIPVEDFPALLSVAHSARDRAVLAIALYTLARQGEIAAITLKDLTLPGRKVSIYREKRKRWTETAMTPELREELTQWLKVYADKMGYQDYQDMIKDHPDWLLVPARQTYPGGWLIKDPTKEIVSMERILKMALTDLGVTSTKDGIKVKHLGEGMHTIRRSGARALFARLINAIGYEGALTFVQAMLDHETQEMTLKYIGMDWVKEQLNNWLLNNSMYG